MPGSLRPSWPSWLLFWVASALVLYGAVLPADQIPVLAPDVPDTSFHGVEYFLLFLVTVNAFGRSHAPWLGRRPRAWALGYCLAMGLVTELLQFYAPGRSPDRAEWLADAVGASAGFLLLFLPIFSRSHAHEDL